MSETSVNNGRALQLTALFAVLLGLVSFPNHLLFRTYALDLGLYTHALWHYAHGGIHDSSLFLAAPQPILADHFDLYLPLFSPLIFVFGSWTLLLVQWAAILVGGWGIRMLLRRLSVSEGLSLLGMVVFYLYFGIYASMAFDYHSNVVATMVFPWCLLALIEGRPVRGPVLALFILFGKENLGFWLGPALLILATDPSLGKATRRMSAGLGVFALAWSILVVGAVMPALSRNGAYAHFDYGILGQGIRDIPSALVNRPLELLRALFVDHIGSNDGGKGTAIKLEFWWMMMASGGWAFLLRPRWGLMALPIIAQKMWQDDPGKWSVVAQYGVEFAPLLAIAVPLALDGLSSQKTRRILIWSSVVLSLSCTIRFMDRTIAYQDRSRIRIYQIEHYTKPFKLGGVRHAIRMIGPDRAVSAQSPAVPHLALRDRLYQYPIIRDADYILLMPKESPYPITREQYDEAFARLLRDPGWTVLLNDGTVLLLGRAPKPNVPAMEQP